MSKYIFALGKDLALSEAELRAAFPSAEVETLADCAIFELDRALGKADFDRLGGCVKMAELLVDMEKGGLKGALADILEGLYGGSKLDYGLSVYGIPEKTLKALLIGLKAELKVRGLSARFANQQFQNLSTAQHKGLGKKGVELVVVANGAGFLIGKVLAVQDIDAYSKRDYEKPFRDMKVGMLPPKLAQIMINLAGKTPDDGAIWDPFCGGGVLLMEGLLMGYDVVGSDINEDTLSGAQDNVEWLQRHFSVKSKADLFLHDAGSSLKFADEESTFNLGGVAAIICEGYLGPPQSRPRPFAALEKLIFELGKLYTDFFRALKAAHFEGPVVIALPFFKSSEGKEVTLIHVVRQIEKMGFSILPLATHTDSLRYVRPDQVVGREVWKFELGGHR